MLKREDAEKLIEMMRILFQDARECQEHVESSDTQFWRRALVRATFSFIEGMTVLLKQQAFVAECNKITAEGQIDFGRLSVLAGESYFISDTGELRCRPLTIPVLNNLRFAFREFAQVHNSSVRLDKSSAEWAALKTALRVRDRLVHPKQLENLEVTDSELEAVETGLTWLNNSLVGLFSEAQRKLRK